MSSCTAPVEGHRSSTAAARCPACRGGTRRTDSYFAPPPPTHARNGGYPAVAAAGRRSSSGGNSRRLRGGESLSFSATEWRTLEPVVRRAETVARAHPERRDLFLCHAWNDREGPAKELCDFLESYGATVWFSEYDVSLGTSLIQEVDRGLANSRAGIVLVTPALLHGLESSSGLAGKELSALLSTDRVIPVAHDTTFDALRDISPLLAARSGLTTGSLSMKQVAQKIAVATAAAG
ncbi:toll/interleukin-1 receptor domain-containing protein [Williamsia sp. CHRR-6]|nr:toll/interleukin-1 receptor domain-containing protein [Williamsia sp. CHRR-6]